MKKIKIILSMILLLGIVLTLTACEGKGNEGKDVNPDFITEEQQLEGIKNTIPKLNPTTINITSKEFPMYENITLNEYAPMKNTPNYNYDISNYAIVLKLDKENFKGLYQEFKKRNPVPVFYDVNGHKYNLGGFILENGYIVPDSLGRFFVNEHFFYEIKNGVKKEIKAFELVYDNQKIYNPFIDYDIEFYLARSYNLYQAKYEYSIMGKYTKLVTKKTIVENPMFVNIYQNERIKLDNVNHTYDLDTYRECVTPYVKFAIDFMYFERYSGSYDGFMINTYATNYFIDANILYDIKFEDTLFGTSEGRDKKSNVTYNVNGVESLDSEKLYHIREFKGNGVFNYFYQLKHKYTGEYVYAVNSKELTKNELLGMMNDKNSNISSDIYEVVSFDPINKYEAREVLIYDKDFDSHICFVTFFEKEEYKIIDSKGIEYYSETQYKRVKAPYKVISIKPNSLSYKDNYLKMNNVYLTAKRRNNYD